MVLQNEERRICWVSGLLKKGEQRPAAVLYTCMAFVYVKQGDQWFDLVLSPTNISLSNILFQITD